MLITQTILAMQIYCKDLPEKIDIVVNQSRTIKNIDAQAVTAENREILFEEWINSEALEKVGTETGQFKLIAQGNFELKASKLKFEGFSILLSPAAEFCPNYDVIRDDYGLQVIVDLPGINQKFPASGYPIEVNISIEEKASLLHIKGKRSLYKYVKQTLNYELYDKFEEPHKYARQDLNFRQSSSFNISIQIPQDISDNNKESQSFIQKGVLFVILPKKPSNDNVPIGLIKPPKINNAERT